MNLLTKKQIRDVKLKYILGFLILALLLAMVSSLMLGFINLGIVDIIKILCAKIGFFYDMSNDSLSDIVWTLRFPRVLLAACVGMGLTLSGIVMQAIVKNPLADPYILGVSSGASLGATSAVFLGVGSFFGSQAIGMCAFVGAVLTAFLVTSIASVSGTRSSFNLLLSGMAVSAVCSSLASLIAFMGKNKEGMEAVTFWLMGNVANARLSNVVILLVLVIFLSFYFSRQTRILNLMLTGYESAMTLGVDIRQYIKKYLMLSGLLVGFIVYNSGMIGFVGLLMPHFVRSLFGPNHRKLLPVAILFGGLVTVIMDILSRTLFRGVDIPLGVIFALLGSPFFIYMVLNQKYKYGMK